MAALAAAAHPSAAAPAAADRFGCWSGHTYPRGDVRHVYAIPQGCVWLVRPADGYYSIGPEIHTRVNGTNDGTALPRDPIGDAAAVCGFTSFVVTWPTFSGAARRVAWGDGTGCHSLPGNRAATWSGTFVWRPRAGRRPARWDPVVRRMSTPLRHA